VVGTNGYYLSYLDSISSSNMLIRNIVDTKCTMLKAHNNKILQILFTFFLVEYFTS
jgi:hypothetical protein